jgi:hypothetical protein
MAKTYWVYRSQFKDGESSFFEKTGYLEVLKKSEVEKEIGNFWEKFHQNPEYKTILYQIENVSQRDYNSRMEGFERLLKNFTELIIDDFKNKLLGIEEEILGVTDEENYELK